MKDRSKEFKESIRPHLPDYAYKLISEKLDEQFIVIHKSEFKSNFEEQYDAIMAAG